jgi:hypothetical protein
MRHADRPNTPTIAEAGYPGYAGQSRSALGVPKTTLRVATLLARDTEKWSRVIRDANIRLD